MNNKYKYEEAFREMQNKDESCYSQDTGTFKDDYLRTYEGESKNISLKANHIYSKKEMEYMKFVDLCLNEEDFYPPSDNRSYKTYIYDIDGGDNFEEYCSEFFEMLDEEEYFD